MSETKPFSWMHPALEVRDTAGKGRGVFARTNLPKGEKLCVLGGYVIRVAEIEDDLGLQIDENFVLSSGGGSHGHDDYFNHSCEPNAGIKGQIILMAMRDIHAGEEVCFDYAMCLHAALDAPRYELSCQCGATLCRGVITEDDWQLPELQARYNGFFSWYIQEKIDCQRGCR